MKLQRRINKVLRCMGITEDVDTFAIGKGHTEHASWSDILISPFIGPVTDRSLCFY